VNADAQLDAVSNAAAEEVLRVIYGDDLEGCAVRLDAVAGVIRPIVQEYSRLHRDLVELHTKGFEAVQLLATPPADGTALTPDDLRSLLGERLDQIRELATKILNTTNNPHTSSDVATPPL
jgi:hypothetical protein